MPTEITVDVTPPDERAALVNVLDAQRVGLIRKVEDVADDLARQAPTVSALSLLGLVKHSATWEERWFQVVFAGRAASDGWPEVRPEPRDGDLHVDDGDTVAHWLDVYRQRIEESNAIVAAHDLGDEGARPDVWRCNLRHVVLHMITETARHAGHADLVRETLDGSTGI